MAKKAKSKRQVADERRIAELLNKGYQRQKLKHDVENFVKFEQLEYSHKQLMYAYQRILTEITNLPFFVYMKLILNDAQDEKQRLWQRILSGMLRLIKIPLIVFTLEPLVRLFAETRIRTIFRKLRLIYSQQALTVDSKDNLMEEHAKWFMETGSKLEKFEGLLLSWESLGKLVGSVLGVAASVVVVFLGLNNILEILPRTLAFLNSISRDQSVNLVIPPLIVTYFVLLFFGIFIHSSFQYNNSLFFTRPSLLQISVKEAEDELFILLRIDKPREIAYDTVWWALNSMILVIALIWYYQYVDFP